MTLWSQVTRSWTDTVSTLFEALGTGIIVTVILELSLHGLAIGWARLAAFIVSGVVFILVANIDRKRQRLKSES